MITLDLTSREPIYEQLKHKITRLAVTGVYGAHQKLPSVRSLAKDLMVNPNTVQKAYQDLERDGVIYSLPGKGSFISEEIGKNNLLQTQVKTRLKDAVRECLSFGIGLEAAITIVESVYKEGFA